MQRFRGRPNKRGCTRSLAEINEGIKKRKNHSTASIFFIFLVVLSFLSSAPALQAAQVVLAWDPNPENPEAAVQGYRVYFGTTSGVYTNVVDAGSLTYCTITGLAAGVTYYFACTDYSATRDESSFSNELVYTTPAQPDPTPGNATTTGGGGCFIATAAYGSSLEPEVVELREFRDRYLLTNPAGKAFVELYYRISPPVAAFIAEHEIIKTAVRFGLAPIVYAVKYPAAALATILLVPAVVIIGKRRKRSV